MTRQTPPLKSLFTLHISAFAGIVFSTLTTTIVQAEMTCDKICEIERINTAMAYDSKIQKKTYSENTERHLPNETVTLWALPTQETPAPQKKEKLIISSLGGEDSPVHFQSGKAHINKPNTSTIQELIDRLKTKKNLRLHFTGHTDNQRLSAETKRYYADNQELSEARASVVANFFQSLLKLPDNNITTDGKAEHEPIASNDNPDGMQKNRRVEMRIWYDDGEIVEFDPVELNRARVCEGKINPVNDNNKFDGFRISIDGQAVNGKLSNQNADLQRCTDVALDQAKIQLQYNNLTAQPRLNIAASPKTAATGEIIQFRGFTNYRSWFRNAEVRFFNLDQSPQSLPLAIIPLNNDLAGSWKLPNIKAQKLNYRLRVYAEDGQFDETKSHTIWLKDESNADADADADHNNTKSDLLAGYANNHLDIQNIPVTGGTLTANGNNIPANHNVFFLGMPVPLSINNRFVTEQIIKEGGHTVEIAVLDETGNGNIYWRDLKFKDNDWFVVALADITIGQNSSSGSAALITGNTHYYDDDVYADGRLAFYAKGKWREKYRVTASVDTREDELDQLLKNFDEKSPDMLLRRLDEEQYYSVYGDDSVTREDAPTQGKAYLKIEDNRSHLMWGNFQTHINENELARIERGLYGAQVQWKSLSTTQYGERNTKIEAFAADPGTLAAREEFRATGGSLYYLQHQSITQGSEQLSIEVRDEASGIILSSQALTPGIDYTINSIQGRVLLTSPLSSVSGSSSLVRDGGLSGHPQFLVTSYEYSPLFDDLDELAVGGRASHWFNDNIAAGLTASNQEQTGGDQRLIGIDFTVRKTPETYVKLEIAESKGEGIGSQNSTDGGFIFNPIDQNRSDDIKATAINIESAFKLDELGLNNKGRGHFYIKQREDGFSAPGQLTRYDTDQIGGNLRAPLTEDLSLAVKADHSDEDGGFDSSSAEVGLKYQLDETWSISSSLKADDTADETGLNTKTGHRNDIAVQIDQVISTTESNYLFAQGTVSKSDRRDKNNRVGVGAERRLNDRFSLNGELSGGTGGVGGKVGSEFRVSDRTDAYLTYALDTDRTSNYSSGKHGQFVSGARSRYSDTVSVFGEGRVQHGDTNGYSQVYGIDYSPVDRWRYGISFEKGELKEKTGTEIDRIAVGLNIGLRKKRYRFGSALEYREDETDAEMRTAWLTRNNFSYQLADDWRAQLRLDLAFNESDRGDSYSGDYTFADIGFAYRPVTNDKLNGLIHYTYLADLAPAEQIASNGATGTWQQRSHIIALDSIYDLNTTWSIGGKYAMRFGEMREGRASGDWVDSTAQLIIGRLNWHIIKRWDLLAEARLLDVEAAEDHRAGVLAAFHYHFGQHMKAGLGYNFTDFSDDLTDLDYDSQGWFLNIVGKY